MSEYAIQQSGMTLTIQTSTPVAKISGGGDVTLFWEQIEKRAAEWVPGTKDEIACWCLVLLAARCQALLQTAKQE